MDKTLRTYLVIDMGMIVRRACPDAFELNHTNADLRETQIVFVFGIIIRHRQDPFLWSWFELQAADWRVHRRRFLLSLKFAPQSTEG